MNVGPRFFFCQLSFGMKKLSNRLITVYEFVNLENEVISKIKDV